MKGALLALGLALALWGPAHAAECLSIGVPGGAGATDEIMAIVREAGKRAGLCVVTMRAPKNRIPALSLDGEILTEPQPPGGGYLVALATPVTTFEGSLFWLPTHAEPTGPDALIGVILGQDWAKRAVEMRGARPFEVRDNRQLMKMMAAGRLDGIMLPSISFRHFRPAFPALRDCKEKNLTPLPVRLVVETRHGDLIARLDAALASLQRDGTSDAILKRYAP